jgi:uncharacterized protein (DUF2252 family)
MSMIYQSRHRFFGIIAVVAITLLAPMAVRAEEEAVILAPVATASEADNSGDAVRATRALAAERALQSGDIGSLQEERLLAIVAPGPSLDATSDCGDVEVSHAANAPLAAPVTNMTAEQTRVLAAQQALRSPDLGSLQEDALTALVEASSTDVKR